MKNISKELIGQKYETVAQIGESLKGTSYSTYFNKNRHILYSARPNLLESPASGLAVEVVNDFDGSLILEWRYEGQDAVIDNIYADPLNELVNKPTVREPMTTDEIAELVKAQFSDQYKLVKYNVFNDISDNSMGLVALGISAYGRIWSFGSLTEASWMVDNNKKEKLTLESKTKIETNNLHCKTDAKNVFEYDVERLLDYRLSAYVPDETQKLLITRATLAEVVYTKACIDVLKDHKFTFSEHFPSMRVSEAKAIVIEVMDIVKGFKK